ncbi:arginine/serine-rich protein 1-like [Haliotis rufescens]|uniref:arginine/serine-rich protein 1-like n=1 Tax=Haliotis rufescens TaxID=6454 RepID=UPI00201EE5ED|nr:arginine/serine-rich protein 1-like [Haliotis rufescens]
MENHRSRSIRRRDCLGHRARSRSPSRHPQHRVSWSRVIRRSRSPRRCVPTSERSRRPHRGPSPRRGRSPQRNRTITYRRGGSPRRGDLHLYHHGQKPEGAIMEGKPVQRKVSVTSSDRLGLVIQTSLAPTNPGKLIRNHKPGLTQDHGKTTSVSLSAQGSPCFVVG